MFNTIYLVGQISPNKTITYEWRQYVRNQFNGKDNFEVIDPCKNNFNDNLVDENIDLRDIYKKDGINVLPHKDRTYVKKADIIIADLCQYDKDKPILGSLFELAWCFDNPEKTVIGIYDEFDKRNVLFNHAFISQTVSCWVSTATDACALVKYYFDI